MNIIENDEKLHDAYRNILIKYPECLFSKDLNATHDTSGLSGIFLTTTPDEWVPGKRILVVGRETRGWNVLKKNTYTDLDTYISLAMNAQKEFLKKSIVKTNQNQCTFQNLLRDLGRSFGTGNIAWANLLCFDWKNSTPKKKHTSLYNEIIQLSESLLKASIKLLSPDIIIFANGVSSVNIRRKFFPISGEHAVCSSPWTNYMSDNIGKIELESFILYNKIKCYRINHPSSISKKSRHAREYLIELIKRDMVME